jgi:hypothetical protein
MPFGRLDSIMLGSISDGKYHSFTPTFSAMQLQHEVLGVP